jgi:hypothetical protein
MPEATEKIVNVPHIFLKRVIAGVVDAAKKKKASQLSHPNSWTKFVVNEIRKKRTSTVASALSLS